MGETFPCLGIESLGQCAYNPANPSNIYFDLGGAVAALAFILAIQQLIRPINLFRLRASGIEFWHLVTSVVLGVCAVAIAALLPSLPVGRGSPAAYPIVWELIGVLLIAVPYLVAALLVISPARLRRYNCIPFCRAAANLLSSAKDEDRVLFVDDLANNVQTLIEYTKAFDRAHGHATGMEFARLRAQGLPLSIKGQPEPSAFYLFTHRRNLERAQYTRTLLALLGDPKFCATLVRDCPWHIARIVNGLAQARVHVRAANDFVQELATQALLSDDSMMIREIGFGGFRRVALLSESLFGNWYILNHYEPLNRLHFDRGSSFDVDYLKRLHAASKMMLETALDNNEYWGAHYMNAVKSAYKFISQDFGWKRENLGDPYPQIYWHNGIQDLYRTITTSFSNLEPDTLRQLFRDKSQRRPRSNLVETVAETIFDSLNNISNSFEGYESKLWSSVIGTFHDVYPFHESAPVGMNPLQQQLALKLVAQLRDNFVKGYYPAISRVLIAAIGPYDQPPRVSRNTAFVLLKKKVYYELRGLSAVYENGQIDIRDFLPDNVTYDPEGNALIHEYRGGEKATSYLSAPELSDIDLFDERNWSLEADIADAAA